MREHKTYTDEKGGGHTGFRQENERRKRDFLDKSIDFRLTGST